jgi:hypothetical protein
MDQVISMAAAAAGADDTASSTAGDHPPSYGSESDGAVHWDEDIAGQSVPSGIFAGHSPQRVKAEFAQLHASIVTIGRREEGDDDPTTNPWAEQEPEGLRARMLRKAAESQTPLFEEALAEYHEEIAAAREKAVAEGLEMTEHMEVMAGVNGAHHWWEEQTMKAKGKGFMSLGADAVIGGTDVDRAELRAKRARDRAARIAMRLLTAQKEKETEDSKPASKWDKAKVATKKKTTASKDHAKAAAKAWRGNAKLAAKTADHLDDPGNLRLLREHSLPPLLDPEGVPIHGEHPAFGLLPAHVVKHVTTKAGSTAADGGGGGGLLGAAAPAAGGAAAAAVSAKTVGGRGGAAAATAGAVDAEAAQQGRIVRKRHNREALAAMSRGNWEERTTYLQYELKRPPSAGAGANSAQAVGKTSRYRRWGRLGATSHLNALTQVELQAAEAGLAGKNKGGRKKREPRKAALPDVPVRRGPRTSSTRVRATGRVAAVGSGGRGGGGGSMRIEEQRVLTSVYLGGSVEGGAESELQQQRYSESSLAHRHRHEDDAVGIEAALSSGGDDGERGGGHSGGMWFRDRVATPNGHEYLAV